MSYPLVTPQSGLMLIDIQAGSQFLIKQLFKSAGPISFATLVNRNQQLLDDFGHRGLPIFIVTVAPKVFPAGLNRHFARTLLVDHNYPNVHHLTKHHPSAFSIPDLLSLLRQTGVDHLLLSGFTTDNGVIKTLRDGEAHGLAMTLIADATVAKTPRLQDKLLATVTQKTTVADVLAQ